MKRVLFIFVVFILPWIQTFGQAVEHSALYKTLKEKDSLLFDRAFNFCESQYLEELVSENFEFYHDQGGYIPNKVAFLRVMEEGICNPSNPTRSRRELLPESLEVFPLYDNGKIYGAIQKGIHRFFEKTGEEIEKPGSIAQFTHLWIIENEQWKLKRVLSYDHHMP